MKKISLILGLFIVLDVIVFSSFNIKMHSSLVYYPGKPPLELNQTIFMVLLALYEAIGVFLICYSRILDLNEKVKKQARNREKASIESLESSDKVKILQAKIDTLEIALKEALNRK